MNAAKTLSAIALFALAGCAAQEAQQEPLKMANADCKIMPATTDSSTGNAPRHATELQQKFAQADLATSSYRMRNLQANPANNNVEDALKDCNRQ